MAGLDMACLIGLRGQSAQIFNGLRPESGKRQQEPDAEGSCWHAESHLENSTRGGLLSQPKKGVRQAHMEMSRMEH